MSDKVQLYFSSRSNNATIGTSNATITYSVNLASILPLKCHYFECEITFLSEFSAPNANFNDVGLINIDFAQACVYNGNGRQQQIAKIYPVFAYNGTSNYTYYQCTTQDNSKFIMLYPINTQNITISLTNFSDNVIANGNMPHYNLVMTLTPIY